MQSLNDDMEELFRRAGEEYPLDTHGADWNKVMQKLHHPADDVSASIKKRNDYRYLWLLLLLPIGFIAGIYFENYQIETAAKSKIEVAKTTGAVEPRTSNLSLQKAANSDGNDSKVKSTNASSNHRSANGNADSRGPELTEINKSKLKPGARINEASMLKPFGNTHVVEGINESKTVPSLAGDKTSIADQKEVTSSNVQLGSNLDGGTNAGPKKMNDAKDGESTATSATSSVDVNPPAPQKQGEVTAIADVNKSSPTNPDDKTKELTMAAKAKRESFKRSFYYSFLIGPDISTVRYETTSKVGYSLGLMLGYQVSRKVRVEAGALWDRKNYKSHGEYLEMAWLQLPLNSIVKSIEGYCEMIEIPVNVKYDFITKQNHSWFVSTGLSSYLMKKEDYKLSYNRYNAPIQKDYSYYDSSRNWFSIINLSAGYQKSFGRYTSINIAPYVKLPLRGVGVGKLPIASTGIYLSVSKTIH